MDKITKKTRRQISKPDMAAMRMRNRRRPLGFVTWNFFEFFHCELVHGWHVPRSVSSFPPGIILVKGFSNGLNWSFVDSLSLGTLWIVEYFGGNCYCFVVVVVRRYSGFSASTCYWMLFWISPGKYVFGLFFISPRAHFWDFCWFNWSIRRRFRLACMYGYMETPHLLKVFRNLAHCFGFDLIFLLDLALNWVWIWCPRHYDSSDIEVDWVFET